MNRKSKKASPFLQCSLFAAAAFLLCSAAEAQPNVNSAPNPVGSGARALGMGGAFVAVADDATAASWNPGGLPQLERPEISAVLNYSIWRESFSRGLNFRHGRTDEVDFGSINYLSAAYPIPWTFAGRNVVVSLNYQRKFDFERKLNFDYQNLTNAFGSALVGGGRVDYTQEGSLSALSPALGIELTDQLSVGMAVNLYDQSLIPQNEWTERTKAWTWRVGGGLSSTGRVVREERYRNFQGRNYTFGVLWKPTDRLSLGAVYHTAWAADADYTSVHYSPFSDVVNQSRRLEFPPAWALGLAYRFPGDHLTVALDVTRRNWDKFVEIVRWPVPVTLSGRRTSPITGVDKWRSPHDPTYTVRLGAEYVFFDPAQPLRNYLWSLRGGLIYDQSPGGGGHFLFNDGLQSYYSEIKGKPEPFYGVTFGAGVLIKNRVNLDLAYQYRWGRGVRKDTFLRDGVDADTGQHTLYLSTVIYF